MTIKIAATGLFITLLSLSLTFCFYWQNYTDLLCLSEISSTYHKLLLSGVFGMNGYLLLFFYHVWYKEKNSRFFWSTNSVDHHILDSKEKAIRPKATSIDTSEYSAEYDLVRTLNVIAVMIAMGVTIVSVLLSRHFSVLGILFVALSPLLCYIAIGVLQFILVLWITLSGFPLNNPYPYRVN